MSSDVFCSRTGDHVFRSDDFSTRMAKVAAGEKLRRSGLFIADRPPTNIKPRRGGMESGVLQRFSNGSPRVSK